MTKKTFYYGYVIVAASTLILMVVYSSYYSYSIFFNSLAIEFNSTKAAISGAFSLTVIMSGLISAFAGGASDRFGPKAVSLFCGLCLGIGLLLMSLVNAIWQVYVIYGIFIAIGVGGLFPAVISTVARWFTDKRGMMIGIVTAGLGVGSIILSPLISYLITAYTWRRAYVITGIIVLAVVLTASQFLKRDPESAVKLSSDKKTAAKAIPGVGRDYTYREAIRTKQFWMLVIIFILSGYGQFSLMVHIVPYATGQGMSPISAASILSVIGGVSIFSRLIIGGIGDKIKVKPLLLAIGATLLLSLICLEFARSLWAFIVVGIIFGLGYGGSSTLQSLVAVEMFGLKTMGTMLGNFILSICIGGSIGPVVTGALFDTSQSYSLSFAICTVAALASLVIILWLTTPKRKPS
jgi:OFA family oxalate/formate antiporter-like MFS transporter